MRGAARRGGGWGGRRGGWGGHHPVGWAQAAGQPAQWGGERGAASWRAALRGACCRPARCGGTRLAWAALRAERPCPCPCPFLPGRSGPGQRARHRGRRQQPVSSRQGVFGHECSRVLTASLCPLASGPQRWARPAFLPFCPPCPARSTIGFAYSFSQILLVGGAAGIAVGGEAMHSAARVAAAQLPALRMRTVAPPLSCLCAPPPPASRAPCIRRLQEIQDTLREPPKAEASMRKSIRAGLAVGTGFYTCGRLQGQGRARDAAVWPACSSCNAAAAPPLSLRCGAGAAGALPVGLLCPAACAGPSPAAPLQPRPSPPTQRLLCLVTWRLATKFRRMCTLPSAAPSERGSCRRHLHHWHLPAPPPTRQCLPTSPRPRACPAGAC